MSPHPKALAAERAAARFLKRQGLKVLTRNFATPVGEIDIIALDGDAIVFVEVKSRSSNDYGYPEDGVTRAKQARLRRAAELYLKRHGLPDTTPRRFDVLALTGPPDGGDWAIVHFEDAF